MITLRLFELTFKALVASRSCLLIIRSKPFTLLRYIDVPIHSQPPNTFISYQTKGYLAFERSLKTFVELNQEELDQCTRMVNTWLCPHVKVVHSGVQPKLD